MFKMTSQFQNSAKSVIFNNVDLDSILYNNQIYWQSDADCFIGEVKITTGFRE